MPRRSSRRSIKRITRRKKRSHRLHKTRRGRVNKTSRRGALASRRSRIHRKRNVPRLTGGFLGFGSLKQGIGNLYRKVIGNKADDTDMPQADGYENPVREYPLNGSSHEMNAFAADPLNQSLRPPPYGMQTGQGYYY